MMADALQTLRAAQLTVELRDDRVRVTPRALAEGWVEFIRENKAELVALLEHERAQVLAPGEAWATPAPSPAILGDGPWTEVPAPDWAPEDLTGWRRWYQGPNGELSSVI